MTHEEAIERGDFWQKQAELKENEIFKLREQLRLLAKLAKVASCSN